MLYLLVVTQDEEDSYSLWTTYLKAFEEAKRLSKTLGITVYDHKIIELDLN